MVVLHWFLPRPGCSPENGYGAQRVGRESVTTFSETIGFAVGDDHEFDEHPENLDRSKLPVLYGLGDPWIQNYIY
jgi:hypothetical protein